MDEQPLPKPLKLAELSRGSVSRRIAADAESRARIARELGLDGVDRLEAELEASPWLDGARVRGRFDAVVRQTCGVTLEPLESKLSGDFERRILPAGSPNAPTQPEEAVLDPDAEDPPDLIEDEAIDLGAILVEQLALEVDPFPRKQGAVFDANPNESPVSPFAVLKDFKPRGG
ncbi:MAG TPA: DUF177 domain-containing protein [Caulobacteraceae bacterium]